jgi:hypothetical protein
MDNLLQHLRAALAGSNADSVIYRHDQNLSVTVPAGECRALDGLGHLCGYFIDKDNSQFDLRQEIDDIGPCKARCVPFGRKIR